jgi:Xaa-Pro dipeptidase
MSLYHDHLQTLMQRADKALSVGGFDHLVIASGIEKYKFLDDMPYPFIINPHFKQWVPLTQLPYSWMVYTPGQKPLIAYYQPDDYWHVTPSTPSGEWVEHFDIKILRDAKQALEFLPKNNAAIIGEADAALGDVIPNNPDNVIHYLHYHRAFKTEWELQQMRAAQRRGVKGHLAAKRAFEASESEVGIHLAYLAATGHNDNDLPYHNIICLNEHAAVLHYQYQQAEKPSEHRSFLIDAGAQVNGYASDITRTWVNGENEFSELVNAVEKEQLALASKVRAGTDYKDLHLECHLRLGGVLNALNIVDMDPGDMVNSGVTSTLFPHGLGHPIGLQVHDVAGFAKDESGALIAKPAGHPYLRMTRVLAPGMVVTIEPGIYFIPSLLEKLRNEKSAKHVNWNKVEAMIPFGGVRIEDEVHCTQGAAENLTRDAWKEVVGAGG